MNKIYLDNAATTPMDPAVIDEMVNVLQFNFGNPSSTHSFGQDAKVLLEKVRREIADYLKVSPSEIVFTSCGTESNNMILQSCVEHLGVERIITSPLEHKCVSETALDIKKRKGVELVYLRPNAQGEISIEDLEIQLKKSDKKTLVSLMHANN
jgi:cysteine desulfurase